MEGVPQGAHEQAVLYTHMNFLENKFKNALMKNGCLNVI